MAIWFLVLLSIVLPFSFGRMVDTSTVDWSNFEVVAICLGGIGIVSAIGEARRIGPANTIVYLRPRTLSSLEVIEIISPKYRDIFELRTTQPVSSKEQYAAMVPWSARLVQLAKPESDGEPPPVRSKLPPLPQGITDPEILVMTEELLDAVQRYEDSRAIYTATKAKLDRTPIEEFGILIAPYLICAAIACSLLSVLHR